MSFNTGYNYIFDVESQEGISELQSYSLKSHTVFVGASFDLSLLNQQSQTQEVDVVEKKLVEMERSYSNVKLDFDNLKLYVDSLFAAESNLNSKLQSEIENHAIEPNLIQKSLVPDFVFLFPSNKSYYYDLFDDTMVDLLSKASAQPDLKFMIICYADLKGMV